MEKRQRKKIVFFSSHLNLGGIEKVLLTYAKGISENKNFEVIFLTCKENIEFDISNLKNITFQNLNVAKIRNCIPKLRSFISKEKPNYLVTASKWTLYAYIANILSCSKTKIITSQHNYLTNNPEVRLLHKITLKWVYPLCYRVIAVSDGIEELLQKEMFTNTKNIIKIYNPIDVAEINKMANIPTEIEYDNYILYVGRLSRVKNLDLLINAFNIFKEEDIKETHLVIIGEGEEKDNLATHTNQLNLNKYIHFIGTKNNPYPYIRKAKLLCLSSSSEAFPTVLLEALSLGITSISTSTNGAIEILKNGKLGYLTNTFDDPKEYANIMMKSCNAPLDAQKLIKNVQDNYSVESRCKTIEELMI